MKEELLKVQESSDLIKIVINNPKHKNALSPEILKLFDEFISNLPDSESKIILITGEGNSFSAGADLKYLSQLPFTTLQERTNNCRLVVDIIQKLYLYPYPVIVAVNGPAIGAATIFLATADFVIAKEGVLISNPELSIGFAPFVTFTAIALRTGFEDALRIVSARPVLLKQETHYPLIDLITAETSFSDEVENVINRFKSINLQAFSKLKLFARKKKWQEFKPIFEEAIKLNAQEYETQDFIEGIKKLIEKSR